MSTEAWTDRLALAGIKPGAWLFHNMGTEISASGTIQRLRRLYGGSYEFKREGNAVLYRLKQGSS